MLLGCNGTKVVPEECPVMVEVRARRGKRQERLEPKEEGDGIGYSQERKETGEVRARRGRS